jgi:hypothetical protein
MNKSQVVVVNREESDVMEVYSGLHHESVSSSKILLTASKFNNAMQVIGNHFHNSNNSDLIK